MSYTEASGPLYPLLVCYSGYLFSIKMWRSKYVSDSGKVILGLLLFLTSLSIILTLLHITKLLDMQVYSPEIDILNENFVLFSQVANTLMAVQLLLIKPILWTFYKRYLLYGLILLATSFYLVALVGLELADRSLYMKAA